MSKLGNLLFKPFSKFLQLQASSSLLLLASAGIALIWANSVFAESYFDLWHETIKFEFGFFAFNKPLHFWINDGLMAIFFLVVGLEIKRELLVGELSSRRQAILPIAAAIGGMLIPAAIYFLFHPLGSPFYKGWGIPTVTDIAFAVGVLTALGNRVPIGLKVFLTALAIVDDIGAILLIALFYSGPLEVTYLLLTLLVLGFLYFLNRSGSDKPIPYLLLGILLWFFVLKSGLHTTIAGVLLAFMIPARGKIDPASFYQDSQHILERFHNAGVPHDTRFILTNEEHQASVQALEDLCEEVQAPLQQIEHTLHPWSSYVILPLFALANAGIHIEISDLSQVFLHPVTLAVVLGLLLGKQAGVVLFSWLAVRFHIADLPQGVNWSMLYGASILAGIGFTMSLFISTLAFGTMKEIEFAKFGIILASLFSGVLGGWILNTKIPKHTPPQSV